MKTKEFIRRVEELGFQVWTKLDSTNNYILLRVGDCEDTFAIIWAQYRYALSTMEDGFTHFKGYLPLQKLYKLCFEYASTPIEDREEEKKFYLKHRWLVQAGDYKMGFLNYDTCNDMLFIYSEHHTNYVKTQFTLKEIEEIKEKFDTDLKDFELVEVEE